MLPSYRVIDFVAFLGCRITQENTLKCLMRPFIVFMCWIVCICNTTKYSILQTGLQSDIRIKVLKNSYRTEES